MPPGSCPPGPPAPARRATPPRAQPCQQSPPTHPRQVEESSRTRPRHTHRQEPAAPPPAHQPPPACGKAGRHAPRRLAPPGSRHRHHQPPPVRGKHRARPAPTTPPPGDTPPPRPRLPHIRPVECAHPLQQQFTTPARRHMLFHRPPLRFRQFVRCIPRQRIRVRARPAIRPQRLEGPAQSVVALVHGLHCSPRSIASRRCRRPF